jgi:hypothetical protein
MSRIANQNGDGIQNGREESRLLWCGQSSSRRSEMLVTYSG